MKNPQGKKDQSPDMTTTPDTLKQAQNDTISLLFLLAQIREAVGDPQGRLMQSELVEHCKTLTHQAACNATRIHLLTLFQSKFRGPERTLLCDILSNKQVLPDPSGNRYGFPTTGKEHLEILPQNPDPLLEENKILKKQLEEARKEAKKWENLYDALADPLEDILNRDSYGPTEEYSEAAKRLIKENQTLRETLKTLSQEISKIPPW